MVVDGDGTKKDALSEKGQPSSEKQNPSNEPQTLTLEQVNERHSKLDRQIAALTKERDTFKASHETLSTKVTEMLRRQEEAEEEAVLDDAPALTALREARRKKVDDETKATSLAEREANLTAREAELADIVERDRILTRTELAAEVAVEKNVSMDAILKVAKEDTREEYLRVAEVLPKLKALPDLTPDSSRTNKGGESLEGKSIDDKFRLAYSRKK